MSLRFSFSDVAKGFVELQAGAVSAGIAIGAGAQGVAEPAKNALKEVPTRVQFTLKPVIGQPFENEYGIDVSALKVPAMINLEAAS